MGALDLFLDLAAMASPSGEERPVADRVAAELRELGLDVDEDGAGAEIGGGTGNLYARLEPTVDGKPLFLCSHMDTVPPTGPIEPVVEDGVVRNAGGTILGADNKSAVVAMVETARRVVERRIPQAGLELLFTPKEEVGLRGAQAFDCSRFNSSFVRHYQPPRGRFVANHDCDLRVRNRPCADRVNEGEHVRAST